MPGRDPKQAQHSFLQPIRESLACISWEPLRVDAKSAEVGESKGLMFGTPGAPVTLDGELADGSHPALFAGIEYTILEDTDPDAPASRRFRVRTDKYTYHVLSSVGDEVLLYHWHPHTAHKLPHLHLGKQQLSLNPALARGAHIPTARVALELLVLLLVDELGVQPVHPTYPQIIGGHLQNFIDHRSWH